MASERLTNSGMRVAIAVPYPLHIESPNGVSDFVTQLKPYLEQQGCSVKLIGPDGSTAADYHFGRSVSWTNDGTSHQSAVSFNKRRAANIALIARPDIIVFHEPLAGHMAHTLMSGAPKGQDGKRLSATIAHFHANAEVLEKKTKAALWVAKNLRRAKFNRFGIPTGITPGYINTVMGDGVDGRVAVSNATANFWKERFDGEYKVIYNGIDVLKLTPEGERIEEWDKDGKKTILFAGRHDPRKGIDHLLEAYRLLSLGRNDIKLKITGEGQQTDALREFVQDRNLPDVEFVGILPRSELIKAYRTTDVFVSPATGGEGFGRTLAEAMACGTLTVGSDIEGYREVIGPAAIRGGEFASMAKPRDPDNLAFHIGRMLNISEENKLVLGRQAADYVRDNFSWPTIARQTVGYYDEVLRQHGMPERRQWLIAIREKRRSKFNPSGAIFDRLRPGI